MNTSEKRRCKGISRQSGERCKNKAVPSSNYCKFHGGGAVGHKKAGGRPKGLPKPPGAGGPPPKGNTNAVKHGAYSARLLPDEQEHFHRITEAFGKELGGDEKLSASDHLLIFRLASIGAKITVAMEKGANDAIVPLQRLELELLRELKTTRASKDGGTSMGNSPAEVVGALLAKIRERQALPPPPPQPIQVDVIDVEVTDVPEDSDEED
jgi:hypothetical protein